VQIPVFEPGPGNGRPVKTKEYTIVLIEEDELTLELYLRELSKSFDIFSFSGLGGVLELIANQDIQAVVIEPESDSGKGWSLIHSIYSTFPERSIPVIVCSTRDTNKEVPVLEVAKYLTKPVLPKTLREKTLEIIHEKNKLKRPS
jgi:DNA-binding response OmpR family regulator